VGDLDPNERAIRAWHSQDQARARAQSPGTREPPRSAHNGSARLPRLAPPRRPGVDRGTQPLDLPGAVTVDPARRGTRPQFQPTTRAPMP